jgi:signal transduction histidine kinase
MLLFIRELQAATGLQLTEDNLQKAAALTFVNVIALSILCVVIDVIRRHYMVQKPVQRITQAAEQIMKGDLSVRIEKPRSIDPEDGYGTVIDYFNKMATELSGIDTLQNDFIANVSHEMKTPLAVIQNYCTILQTPDLDEEKRMEYAKLMADAARDLANMVTNILKLNKLENKSIYPNMRTYDLGEQLCECMLAFENLWERKELEIETDLEENVNVKSDPELLSLVWNNLLSNAIKFTNKGGTVRLSLQTSGNFAVVRVQDTGCGIRPEEGRRIFEKFYQADTSHATKGNGLGLALVKRVIDIVGGDISVESEIGKGSTFTVVLKRV